MPVKPGYFDHFVIAARSVVEAGFDSSSDNDQIDNAGAYMQPVKSRNHEKGCAELGRTQGVAPETHAFLHDQFSPFKRLHTHEHYAEARSRHHEPERFVAFPAIAHVDGHRHRAAR